MTNINNKKLIDEQHLVINGDCIVELDNLIDRYKGKVRLVVADPPYNTSHLKFGKVTVDMSLEEYISWCEEWISKCIELLTDDGSIFIMGHPKIIPYIAMILDKKDLFYTNQIIYHYTDGMPINNMFAQRYESILYYRKNEDNFVFNLDDVRVEPIRYDKHSNKKGKNPGDVWADYLKNNLTEIIAKKVKESEVNITGELDISIKNVIEEVLIELIDFKRGDVWLINRVRHNSKERVKKDGRILHVSQKPLELLRRIVLAASNENDIVLDPFSGTGTTSVAAKQLGRNSITIELNDEYIPVIVDRISNAEKEIDNVNLLIEELDEVDRE